MYSKLIIGSSLYSSMKMNRNAMVPIIVLIILIAQDGFILCNNSLVSPSEWSSSPSSPQASLKVINKEKELNLSKRTNEDFHTNQPNYNQWDKDGNPITSNEIDITSSVHKQTNIIRDDQIIAQPLQDINSNIINIKQDYQCGRAQANKARYKNSLGDLNPFRQPLARQNKYRPTEIRMPRIIGGDMASPGEFPWTASIKLNEQPICGGSLIDKSWILTAAHCVVGYNPKNLTVRLGAYRIKDLSETHTVDIPVSMFVVHKDYSMPRPFSNDIAIVKLQHPVEYSDYIIPICLPTEDQITMTSINMVVNDYSNRHQIDLLNRESEQSGIVISTKMSDTDIAKCFSKLEQNYLNSIGLGSINSAINSAAATESSVSVTPAQSSDLSSINVEKHQYSFENPLDESTTHRYPTGSSSNNIIKEQNSIYSYPTSNQLNDNRMIKYITQQFREQQQQQQQQLYKKPNHYNQLPQVEFDFNLIHNNNNINNRQPSIQSSYSSHSDSQYVYYGVPWAGKSSLGHLTDYHHQFNANDISRDNNKIKLSRLPISKELLKEIQSVGSESMSSLGLSLQHSDLINMASDLNQSPANTISNSPTNNLIVPTITTATNNNEQSNQLKSPSDDSSSRGIFTSFLNKVIRTSTDEEEAEDDPTKYSGLSGIVVGWGWVRELDEDDSSSGNNKGYSSITLQKVKLPILRNNVCEAWFQSQSKKITLLPSQFCAGFNSGGKDACRGDSGGPMIIEDNSDTGRYKLIGIVSAGIGCARRSLPGLYTRVASFIPWINTQMQKY